MAISNIKALIPGELHKVWEMAKDGKPLNRINPLI